MKAEVIQTLKKTSFFFLSSPEVIYFFPLVLEREEGREKNINAREKH